MADTARGERLRQARVEAGLTQKQAAEKVGTTDVSISNWENGANISEPMLTKLGEVYGKPLSWLRYGNDLARAVTESPNVDYNVTPPELLDVFQRNPAFRRRLPPKPYARVYEHIDRMLAAGCTSEQIDEAERLMIDGAYNKLNARDPRERSDEEMILDIDDAWDWIKEVLGRAGVKDL